MTKSDRVPETVRAKFEAICRSTDAFCDEHLNAECKQLVRQVVAALARKRPSPLLSGKEAAWAAGAVHAAATTNFLFDRSLAVHCEAKELSAYFGLAMDTTSAKSKQIRDMLRMHRFDHKWMLPSKIEQTSLVWMIQVNGFVMDARDLPVEIQEIVYKKGLIPYVYGERPK